MAEDEIEIQVSDEIGGDTTVTGGAAAGGDDPVAVMRAQVAESQATAQREAARAAEAERRAAQASDEARRSRAEATGSQEATITSGLSGAEAERVAAKAAYKAAFDAGDGDALAEAQDKMSEVNARIIRLKEAKDDLAARPAREDTARHVDPMDRATAQMTPQSAAWVRAHPDTVSSPTKISRMLKAHEMATADADMGGGGLTPDTPEYFAFLETKLGYRQAEAAAVPVVPKPRSAGPPVAPVNGAGTSGGSMSSQAGPVVKLSQKELESATDGTIIWNYDDPTGKKRWRKGDPIGKNEFARRKHAQTQSGQYDRQYLDS